MIALTTNLSANSPIPVSLTAPSLSTLSCHLVTAAPVLRPTGRPTDRPPSAADFSRHVVASFACT